MTQFGILGPVEVTVSGRPLALGGARARDVLATLLVHSNQAVSSDQLVDELWPGQPADKATASLQVRLSELRKLLREAEGCADRLATRPPGYLLRVSDGELDARCFEDLFGTANDALTAGQPDAAIGRYDDALCLWRGATALAGVDAPSARMESARLGGDLGGLVAELEALTKAHPLRERLWAARMLALYRNGRQADALGAYRELLKLLDDELGIPPGPNVREVHARILRQDPALLA
jgi:DNA-binding SARP family transcriptional activator